jgi:5-methyltetrahydrofolate--homocysteine methyltransferase
MEFSELSGMVIRGDHRAAERWTRDALEAGVEPRAIIDAGLVPGMEEVGRRFKCNEFHLPEVLVSARAMKASLKLVQPLVARSGAAARGRVVMGTVRGDLHDIGKNLVSMMLEGAGFEVHDLGVDVAPEAFVRAAEQHAADVVGISGLLTTSMPMMRETVKLLRQSESGDRVRVMVGGAPVNQAFADQIGADGYAPNGAAAVDLANALVSTH